MTGASVEPTTPGALAVWRGVLYVVDVGRDQILRRLANGRFDVVAGTGRRGFSGDGHLATRAAISVGYDSGLAVATNGTVFFSDSGNGRVRAVSPDGVISTVAGGGATVAGVTPIRADRARLTGIGQPNGLAIGPNGQLYIAANGVFRLAAGELHWVVGSDAPALNRGFTVYGSNPAHQQDVVPAYTIAFDGRGDLLVGGGNTWSLYERTASGRLRFVQGDRAEGGLYAATAEAPAGTGVLAGGGDGLARFHPSGAITRISAPGLATILAPPSHFAIGQGLAVAANGTLYLDTDANNGFSTVSAIVEVAPSGRASLLWRS